MTDANIGNERLDLPVLLVVLSGMYALMATLSMTFPLLSLLMERAGTDERIIGLLGSMPAVGLIVAAALIAPLNRRLGTYRFLLLSGLTGATMFALLGLFQHLAVWFVALFLMGCAVDGIFVICEGWINSLANERNRGRVIGIYGTVASLGLMTGPLVLTLVGTRGATPFVVGVVCLLLFLVPITILRRHVPTFEGDHAGGAIGFLPLAPALVLAVLAFALFETTFASLFPVYASRAGLEEVQITSAIAVMFAGYLCWQIPIGLLAERVNARLLLIGCAAGAAVAALLLGRVIDSTPALWLTLFVWGGLGAGTYTLALVELGQRFRGARLLAGNAAFGIAWGAGGIIGPATTGALIGGFGTAALPAVFTTIFATLAALSLVRFVRS
ncbi:MAG: MFS transporter [Halofilum sp. (in: g-proteobacteria)]|nr:MFS transporter [Halofilum sp. (in: g-proteobacteria)]